MNQLELLFADVLGDIARWRDSALCAQVDPDLFFPEKGCSPADAIRVCRRCPVQTECLADALRLGEVHGVWSATTPRQRMRMLNRNQPRYDIGGRKAVCVRGHARTSDNLDSANSCITCRKIRAEEQKKRKDVA